MYTEMIRPIKELNDGLDNTVFFNRGIHIGGPQNFSRKIWGATKFYLEILGGHEIFSCKFGGLQNFSA